MDDRERRNCVFSEIFEKIRTFWPKLKDFMKRGNVSVWWEKLTQEGTEAVESAAR